MSGMMRRAFGLFGFLLCLAALSTQTCSSAALAHHGGGRVPLGAPDGWPNADWRPGHASR